MIESSIFSELLLVNLCWSKFCSKLYFFTTKTHYIISLNNRSALDVEFRVYFGFNICVYFNCLLWNTEDRRIRLGWPGIITVVFNLFNLSRTSLNRQRLVLPRQSNMLMIKLLKIQNLILIWSKNALNYKTR